MLTVLFALLGTTACPGGTTIVDPPIEQGCESHEECGEGNLCLGGKCELGQCDTSTSTICTADVTFNCCKGFQICNFDRTCIADPNAPIGGECEENDDCSGIGEFCSGGNCYNSAEQGACAITYNCPQGERCDQQANLCVPDIGGCSFCGDAFPELCCEEGFACDETTDRCFDVDGVDECTVATENQDCLPLEVCSPDGRCVQCLTQDHCGPGLECNLSTNVCFSAANQCGPNGECTGDKVCSLATNECVIPLCLDDGDCQADNDARWRCDTASYACFLPAPMCEALDTDEPNNAVSEAQVLDGLVGQGVLCRLDTDFKAFAVTEDKRYSILVEFPDFNVGGNRIGILDEMGTEIDSVEVPNDSNEATVVAVSPEGLSPTNYYLRLTGTSDRGDIWPYTITITETDAPDITTCADEMAMGVEPNNNIATATDVDVDTSRTFARCDGGDVDFYRVEVPVQNGIRVSMQHFRLDGDLSLRLYDSEGNELDENTSFIDSKSVDAKEGGTVFYVEVELYDTNDPGIDGQQYTLDFTAEPRPEVCLTTDVAEPQNDQFATADPITNDMAETHLRCVTEDVDHHAITLPAGFGGKVDVSFMQNQGDILLELLDEQGDVAFTSDDSTGSNGVESIEIPFSGEEQAFVARISLSSGGGTVGQEYSIIVNTFDAGVCVASEMVPNGTFTEGQCVGTVTSDAACVGTMHTNPLVAPDAASCAGDATQAGCGSICGTLDEDWFRVGKLNDGQLLRATVKYDNMAMNGRIGVQLVRATGDLQGINVVAYESNTANEGTVELAINAPTVNPLFAREYGVVVKPEGTEGFAALPYTVDIEVGPPCLPDDTEPSEDPSQSYLIRTMGESPFTMPFHSTLCGFDTDVYEIYVFPGETANFSYAGPPGTTMYIGERPADITDPAVQIAGTELTALEPCTITLEDGSTPSVCLGGAYGPQPVIKQLFLTVKRDGTSDTTNIGLYRLGVNVQP